MQYFEDNNLLMFVAADLRDARDEFDVGRFSSRLT